MIHSMYMFVTVCFVCGWIYELFYDNDIDKG